MTLIGAEWPSSIDLERLNIEVWQEEQPQQETSRMSGQGTIDLEAWKRKVRAVDNSLHAVVQDHETESRRRWHHVGSERVDGRRTKPSEPRPLKVAPPVRP